MKNEVELPFGDDAENRLTRVQNQGYDTISESYYDAPGRRVRKVVTNSDNDGDYRYLWNQDWQLMNVFVFADSKLKPRQRLVHAGSPTAWYKSPSPFKGEGWGEGVGGGRAYIDDHICIYVPGGMGGGRKYFHTDAQYNTQMVTDASSNSVASYVLSAYGLVETITQPGMGGLGSYATNNAMIHQGLPYDAETGSYYNRNRVYLPGLGRFAQRDLWNHSESTNVYDYAHDNPRIFGDPTGLSYIFVEPPPEWPKPPGYDPFTWGWRPNQNYVGPPADPGSLVDPGGDKWRYHPEDDNHYPHWDRRPGDGTKERVPIDGKPPIKPPGERGPPEPEGPGGGGGGAKPPAAGGGGILGGIIGLGESVIEIVIPFFIWPYDPFHPEGWVA